MVTPRSSVQDSARMLRAKVVRIAAEDETAIEELIRMQKEILPALIQEAATTMLENGWTQSEMARLFGVSPQAIHKRFAA
jgi:hypothetical protein